MTYRLVIQSTIESNPDEIIGAKEAIAEALELMGCDVNYINVMPEEVEE